MFNLMQTFGSWVDLKDGMSFNVNEQQPTVMDSSSYSNSVLWNKTWGGTASDEASGIWCDGIYVYTVGNTTSYGANGTDGFLVKWYASNGSIVWNRTITGPSDDALLGVWGTADVVYTCGFINGPSATQDAILLKWNATTGNQIWNRTYDCSSNQDIAYSCMGFSDVIYIGGASNYSSRDMFGLVVKWYENGTLAWYQRQKFAYWSTYYSLSYIRSIYVNATHVSGCGAEYYSPSETRPLFCRLNPDTGELDNRPTMPPLIYGRNIHMNSITGNSTRLISCGYDYQNLNSIIAVWDGRNATGYKLN
jgi:hypothetical protein